jgi:hypothetical protein
MRRTSLTVSVLALVTICGCTTYRDQLVRSQRAFDQGQNDQSLGLLRDLEKDVSSLSMPEQAEYAYLRGMTDYRVGYRVDARHWLAIAKSYDESSPGVLPTDWKTRLDEALTEMNGVVYQDGLDALGQTRKVPDDEPKAGKPTTTKKTKTDKAPPPTSAPPQAVEPTP